VRVLLASNYFHPEHTGGIETVAYNLARGYRASGHEVRWVAADCGVTPHAGDPDDIPLPALNFTESRLGVPYPLPTPSAMKRLRKAAAWCDVLHIHDCLYPANIALFFLSRRMGKPVLLTQQIGMVPYRSRALRWLLRRAYGTIGRWMVSRAEQVTFVSPLVMRWFGTFSDFSAPPLVCVNGVDLSLFTPAGAGERAAIRGRLGVEGDRPLLLFVGRFVEKKGLHLLRTLAERHPEWSWMFVGRDDGASPAAWGLPNVSVLPPIAQAELRDLYVAADLSVLPSVGEGLPLAALEALVCGTPVLTTEETARNAGELAALLESTPPATDAIGAAVARMLASDARGRGGALAARAAEQCGWTSVTARYLGMLDRLVGNRQPARTS
jgi:glycosyltransferase involved in cell wall biosynthesis